MKMREIISYILIIISFAIMLLIIAYFQSHSPEFVTHEQFYLSIIGITGSLSTAIFGVWMNVSNKLMEFAKDLGEIKGTLKQFATNHSRKN